MALRKWPKISPPPSSHLKYQSLRVRSNRAKSFEFGNYFSIHDLHEEKEDVRIKPQRLQVPGGLCQRFLKRKQFSSM